jgi:class 3 adenylate cyclase
MDADWELYTETVAHFTYGWSAGEAARKFAAQIRESVAPEKLKIGYRAIAGMDATPLLSQVKCPALVLRRRQASFSGVDAARALASGMPDARLTLLEGSSLAPHLEDTDAVVRAIDDFLGEGQVTTKAEASEAGAFRTILFTDIEGSTAMTQRLGDAKARDVLREHDRIVREALKSHAGSEMKAMGDGFMVSFSSTTGALECAIAMQRALDARNQSAEEPVRVRIGLNAGEPIAEEEDLFGTTVIMAARIAAKAEGGEILASEAVRQIVAGKDFEFSDRGATVLRGFDDPVRLYELRWREET